MIRSSTRPTLLQRRQILEVSELHLICIVAIGCASAAGSPAGGNTYATPAGAAPLGIFVLADGLRIYVDVYPDDSSLPTQPPSAEPAAPLHRDAGTDLLFEICFPELYPRSFNPGSETAE